MIRDSTIDGLKRMTFLHRNGKGWLWAALLDDRPGPAT
jgi:hypothetical protein